MTPLASASTKSRSVPKKTLDAAKGSLQSWQMLDSFKSGMDAVLNPMPSEQLFRQPGLTWLKEAWVIYWLAKAMDADAVRLCDGEWPDAAIRVKGNEREFEIVEAMEKGRKRGAEKWGDSTVAGDRVSNWIRRAVGIPESAKTAALKKSAKGYPATASLLIYLNIGEYGIRQKEIEASLHAATEVARNGFRQVWVFWKARFYLLWDDGKRCDDRLGSDYWRES